MPKIFSGKKVVRILCREFGFSFVSQKGSHVKLQKRIHEKNITTIVPNHRELSPGTLSGVLDLANISEEDFRDKA